MFTKDCVGVLVDNLSQVHTGALTVQALKALSAKRPEAVVEFDDALLGILAEGQLQTYGIADVLMHMAPLSEVSTHLYLSQQKSKP